MSASQTDNPMARFLFAILQQKNLKDIDWTLVAHNPILNQRITNGHAARMRFSRFRSAVLGLEPTRRNRTSQQPRSRVTKAKRGKKGSIVKSESVPPDVMSQDSMSPEPHLPQESRESSATIIKQETSPYVFDYRFTPRLTPGTTPGPTSGMVNPHGMIQPRFLTPGSETDGYSPHGLTSSPTSDLMNPNSSFDYRSSPCPERPDPMWSQVPTFPTFGAPAYSFDAYENGSCEPCEHPPMHHQPLIHLAPPAQSIESEGDYIVVKHEDWDQYH